MCRIGLSLSLAPALLLANACGPSNIPTPDPTPDRVLVVNTDGKVMRQSTGDEHSRVKFFAPMDKVWRALVASYADLGIDPAISDSATGRYGNAAFVVPRRVMGRPIAQFFDCGSTLTGPTVDAGRGDGCRSYNAVTAARRHDVGLNARDRRIAPQQRLVGRPDRLQLHRRDRGAPAHRDGEAARVRTLSLGTNARGRNTGRDAGSSPLLFAP